ncbi:hypothetical protein [uncultured Clostridium sp.]|uniref:hypothetical protein n=1 Tax=uncultured Clostridium sp. TaxID=59620 RepID=UPI0032163EAE
MNKEQLEVLEVASEYIVKLIGGIKETVSCFQSGKEKQGLDMITPIGNGIGYIMDVITLLPLELDSDATIENLNTQLEELVQGLENEDYVLVSDMFSYEILPIFEEIKIHMEHLNINVCEADKKDIT